MTKEVELLWVKDSFKIDVRFTKHYTTSPTTRITDIKDIVPEQVFLDSSAVFENLYCKKVWKQPGMHLKIKVAASYPENFTSELKPTPFQRKV